ncbi:MAG TPA: hypothetical protein VL171_07525 [Verrucomicrobiae bacterium]|nr:hypothetical protein [Verrucomicrobiae bacterium]
MKIPRVLLVFCSVVAVTLFAEETNTPGPASITNKVASAGVMSNTESNSITIDGTTYKDVRWGRLTPATVTIYHETGVATVPLADLPPDLQKQFGYDPQKAAAWQAAEQKTAAARLAAEQKAAAAREAAERKAAEQKAADQKAAAAKAEAEKKKSSPVANSTSTNAVPKKVQPNSNRPGSKPTVDDILNRMQQNYGQPDK